jgi:hypothetical protein
VGQHAAIESQQQVGAAGMQVADGSFARTVAFADAVWNMGLGVAADGAQKTRQQRGGCDTVNVVVADDGDLLAAHDRLRQTLGADFGDRLVYASLAYLGPGSGLQDAFLALLSADRDLAPRADGQGGAPDESFGQHACTILQAGLARGFVQEMGALRGEACGLDLTALAEADRLAKSPAPTGRRGPSLTVFGRSCSTVFGAGADGPGGIALSLLFAVPLAVAALRRKRRSPWI